MSGNGKWMDFNTAEPQTPPVEPANTEEIKARLLARLREVLHYLLPAGKVRHGKYLIGDVGGNTGESLSVELKGPKAGIWHDFATGEGGDIISLWAAVRGFDTKGQFPELMAEIGEWLGMNAVACPAPPPEGDHRPILDDLGPVTARWDYHDRDGNLIACVYRHDPPGGKQFRPWDVKARRMRAPSPRPLYDIPGILASDRIVLVEGEKAAQALIDIGIAATTAMNGAGAPVDKTDWSPLVGKHVLIWPDNDAPGKAYAVRAARAIEKAGAASVAILEPPRDKPEKWDAADAVAEGMDIEAFLERAPREQVKTALCPVHSVSDLLKDTSAMPQDLIAPRILTPGGMLVLGGAPKVGKSDFLLTFMMHMAGGASFLGFTPPRPLRVFFLQAEIQYHYLRERVQNMKVDRAVLDIARHNLFITEHLRLVLDEAGVGTVTAFIRDHMGQVPDIIVIDPIRNVFDGGPGGGSENDNEAMMFFLRERIEALREAVDPACGLILAHHTRKLSKAQLEEDPFLALSGASALRGYYTSGIIMHRPDEALSERKLEIELRNGPALPPKLIDKVKGPHYTTLPNSSGIFRFGHSLRHMVAALSGWCRIQFLSRSNPVLNHDLRMYPCDAFLMERRPSSDLAQA